MYFILSRVPVIVPFPKQQSHPGYLYFDKRSTADIFVKLNHTFLMNYYDKVRNYCDARTFKLELSSSSPSCINGINADGVHIVCFPLYACDFSSLE